MTFQRQGLTDFQERAFFEDTPFDTALQEEDGLLQMLRFTPRTYWLQYDASIAAFYAKLIIFCFPFLPNGCLATVAYVPPLLTKKYLSEDPS